MIVCSKKSCVQQHAKGQCRRPNLTLLIAWSLFLIVTFSSCSLGPSQAAPPPPEFVCPTITTNPLKLNMVYDSSEQLWIKDVINDFNSQHITACDGPITVQATPMDSGLSMQEILNGKLQPDVWSPGGDAWISLLNQQWHSKNGSNLVNTTPTDSPTSLITSPIVIAMWQSQAKAMGWPGTSIGWNEIASLIVDPKGWGLYKHPQWGKFKFASPNSEYSNAGLDALISMSYAGTCSPPTTPGGNPICKNTGLTLDDVNSSATSKLVTSIERSAISYNASTSALVDEMLSHGLTYLNAIAVEESLVVQANSDKTKYPGLPDKFVAVYPSQSNVVATYPLAALQGDWLTPSRNAAVLKLRDFLVGPTEQAKAVKYGFRPTSGGVAAPIDDDHGVDPGQSNPGLPMPDIGVLQAIQSNWIKQRRPFDVMLLVDTSGSMNFPIGNVPKIDGAKAGLKSFVKSVADSDQLGLTTFSDHTNNLSSIATPLRTQRPDALSHIDGMLADGGVKLYDTVGSQFQQLQQLPPTSIRAMIVLSNQTDNQSKMNLNQLMSLITPPSTQDSGEVIKIFTIAYGSNANVGVLTQIAKQTGGQEFSATPQNLQDVYRQIGEIL